MEIDLLVALGLGTGNNTHLERLQGKLEGEWPQACGLPPIVPVLVLGTMPTTHELLQAKLVSWPRVELDLATSMESDPHGDLIVPLPVHHWEDYRRRISLALHQSVSAEQPGGISCGPWLLLARGPKAGQSLIQSMQSLKIVMQSPILQVIRILRTKNGGSTHLNWEILAEHRVAKPN